MTNRIGSIYAVTLTENGKTVTRLEMKLDGDTRTWVEYDLPQLENLIAMLTERLDEMVKLAGDKNG